MKVRPLTKADLGASAERADPFRSDRRCNAALCQSLGSWSWESNRTGRETEVIVKEKCKELIQCQKT